MRPSLKRLRAKRRFQRELLTKMRAEGLSIEDLIPVASASVNATSVASASVNATSVASASVNATPVVRIYL